VLNQQGQYQKLPLRDLQAALDRDPIVINASTTTTYWSVFALLVVLIAALFLLVWNIGVRLAYIALIALVFWGVAALIRPGTGFGPVLITGLYALVPALLVSFLLSQVGLNIPLTTTFFLVVFWVVGLIAALMPRSPTPASSSIGDYFRAERPLRAWRALIALPLSLDIALETIFGWNLALLTWPLALLTFGALLAVSAWPLIKKGDSRAPG
jgi:hypothetical protein